MIIIVEPVRLGLEHQAFNAALVQAAVAAFPADEVQFWAEQSHLDSVAEMVDPALGVKLVAVATAPRRASLWQRLGADSRLARQAIGCARRSGCRVIFSSVTIPLLWACRLAGGSTAHQVGGVLHGGLAELRWRPRFNLWKRWISLRWALAKCPRWMTFWVLEQSIAEALGRFAPELVERFSVFPHPLPPDLVGVRHQPPIVPLAIGLLGLATPQKGLLRFLAVAEAFYSRGAEFHLVGRIHDEWRGKVEDQLSVLAEPPEVEPMPREIFVQRVSALSYSAFFFEGEHYALTASGVLLDCIALGIPLLACRHPMFQALEEEVGEIGHFCEPGDELAMVAGVISNFDAERYALQSKNMMRLRDSRLPSALSVKMRSLLQS